MDTAITTVQLWWNLPTYAKLFIFPQPLVLPVQVGSMLYKGYTWLYPPSPKKQYIVVEINFDEEDEECVIVS
jgi:hypothetical protein